MDRKDFKFISGWIEKDSTVLDLGCGDSTLLNSDFADNIATTV